MFIMIEGKHPLYESSQDSEESFIRKLKSPKFTFSSKFTNLAKDFFLKLCNPSPIERYTTDKALKHPWITRVANGLIPLT